MSSEKQYTELYKLHAELINRHSAPALNALREKAFEEIQEKGFPDTRQENFKRTDLNTIFAPDYGLNLNRLNIPVNPYEVFRCDVPNLSTWLYFLVNDSFYNQNQSKPALPDGVLVGSLRDFALSHPDLVSKYYGKIARSGQDTSVALNTLLVQDGFFLYIPKGTIIEKPLQLVNVLRSDVDFMTNRRILIIAEEQTEAKILICDHAMDDNTKFLTTQVCEIFVGEGASFDYSEIEENTTNTTRVSSTFVSQEANSKTAVNGITLYNGTTRNNYYITFKGENAESSLSGMAISDKSQHIDNYSVIDHAVPHCNSNELFKYVLNDAATGAFSGRIIVRPGAQKTAAFQSNKNLCATADAKMFTKPQLEIYADDVKCSHGATVGQLDHNALFYLRSRGIPEKEARLLLMFAFTNDVIENIHLDALKDRLRLLVEKRFRGELAKCSGCKVCQ